jgi:hypothetical protein
MRNCRRKVVIGMGRGVSTVMETWKWNIKSISIPTIATMGMGTRRVHTKTVITSMVITKHMERHRKRSINMLSAIMAIPMGTWRCSSPSQALRLAMNYFLLLNLPRPPLFIKAPISTIISTCRQRTFTSSLILSSPSGSFFRQASSTSSPLKAMFGVIGSWLILSALTFS